MALDTTGAVIPGSFSAGYDTELQDPASTTKAWTFYTVLALIRDHRIPQDFLATHANAIRRMLVFSDNNCAMQVASDAAKAAGRDGTITNAYLTEVPGFADLMNEYAGKAGLDHTHFKTASGMPEQGHYSTALDMARMMWHLRHDFNGTPVEGAVGLAGLDSYQGRANTGARVLHQDGGTNLAKTGTARGIYGSDGKYSFVGATDHGTYALAGVATSDDRASLARALANRTNNVQAAFPRLADPGTSPLQPR
ncbi:MAG: hypothetical protein WDN72_06425 [Alphaproteobacteria bacterium]